MCSSASHVHYFFTVSLDPEVTTSLKFCYPSFAFLHGFSFNHYTMVLVYFLCMYVENILLTQFLNFLCKVLYCKYSSIILLASFGKWLFYLFFKFFYCCSVTGVPFCPLCPPQPRHRLLPQSVPTLLSKPTGHSYTFFPLAC